jgi:lipopolysaccharide biosynthesis glycosyltransferase
MKFLYCLASSDKDIYLERLLCSITTLRYYNKNAFVSLLVDDLTAASLTGFRAKVKEMANEFKVAEFPKNMPLKNRSRQLKTRARNIIDGDFLYLDNDTIICSEISEDEMPNCEIGAVADLHTNFEKYQQQCKAYKLLPIEKYKKLGFTTPSNGKYFNGGVFFVKDTELTRNFFKYWQETQSIYSGNGFALDQPALSQTNIKFNYLITELDGTWNSMFEYDVNYIHKAKIMHFIQILGSARPRIKIHPLMESKFYEEIKKEQKISEEQLKIMLNPKENFYSNTYLIWLDKLRWSYVFRSVMTIYNKLPFLFNLLESLCAFGFKIRNITKKERG